MIFSKSHSNDFLATNTSFSVFKGPSINIKLTLLPNFSNNLVSSMATWLPVDTPIMLYTLAVLLTDCIF